MHARWSRLSIAAILIAQLIAFMAPTSAQATADTSTGTRLVLLGTGTPNAEADRSGPALAIVVNGHAYLVDAGPGVVRRASAAHDNGIDALDPPNLNIVFLTHLHSDHTVGLPDLIFTPWTLGRTEPLRIIGPRGTRSMAKNLEQAYKADVRIRIDGAEPANRTGWKVEARDVRPGVVYEDANVRVTAFTVPHGTVPQAFGYRFDTADRSIVVSGDTAPSDAVVQACHGCDILVHEVYSQEGFEKRSPVWQHYHSTFHTSATALGHIASRAHPGLLVLTHELLWGSTPDEVVREVRATFHGRVVFGRDLDTF